MFEIPFRPRKVNPTVAQQLHHQRTGPRNNYSLTETGKPFRTKKKDTFQSTRKYVNKVVYADNLDSPRSPRSLSPISSGSLGSEKSQASLVQSKQHSFNKLPDDPIDHFLSIKRRTSTQGRLQDLKEFSQGQESPRQNDILDFIERVRGGKVSASSAITSVKSGEVEAQEVKTGDGNGKAMLMKIVQRPPVDGALYGPIVAKRRQGVASKLSEKFRLPRAMVDRLAKKNSVSNLQEELKRKSLREHMNKPFPNSDSSSNDGDDMEKVKSLTLVRTGYCTIPKIRVGQRRRKDRLKTNRFLSKHQINRIRYLLFDERQKWAGQKEVDLDKQPPPLATGRHSERARKCSERVAKSEQSFDQDNQNIVRKLKNFLRDYQKTRDKKRNIGITVGFEAFKKGLLLPSVPHGEVEGHQQNSSEIKKVSLFDDKSKEGNEKGKFKKFSISQPPSLFRKTGSKHSFRGVDARDAQYVDPNFMTKQRFPEVNQMKRSKYVLQSTMRYHPTMRERLQVNPVDCEEYRCGFGDQQYLNCLATDWDKNYVKEVQPAKKFKRFRVKR